MLPNVEAQTLPPLGELTAEAAGLDAERSGALELALPQRPLKFQ